MKSPRCSRRCAGAAQPLHGRHLGFNERRVPHSMGRSCDFGWGVQWDLHGISCDFIGSMGFQGILMGFKVISMGFNRIEPSSTGISLGDHGDGRNKVAGRIARKPTNMGIEWNLTTKHRSLYSNFYHFVLWGCHWDMVINHLRRGTQLILITWIGVSRWLFHYHVQCPEAFLFLLANNLVYIERAEHSKVMWYHYSSG